MLSALTRNGQFVIETLDYEKKKKKSEDPSQANQLVFLALDKRNEWF